LLVAALAAAGCSHMTSSSAPMAVAKLETTTGNNVTGTVKFTQSGDKVHMEARVAGLTPGAHGFHIHEKGDCSSGDGMSTKGHYNPLNKQHAHYSTPERHAGDMPAIKAYLIEDAEPEGPFGAKGVGESGTIGSTPAVWNAVIDALSHRGIRHLDMPLTPDRVWAALNRS